MFNLKVLGRILMTAFKWAAVWALAGAAMGVVATLIEPDTGHIPRHLVPLMIAVPSAAFGAIAGLIFASVVAPGNISVSLGPKGRTLLGSVIGGLTGLVFMNLLTHSVVAVLFAAILGALLAIRFTRLETTVEKE
jgi:hypothetical protein